MAQKFTNRRRMFALFIIGIIVLAFWAYSRRQQPNVLSASQSSPRSVPAWPTGPWSLYSTTPQSGVDIGPKMSIKVLPLSQECLDGPWRDVDTKLNEALLIEQNIFDQEILNHFLEGMRMEIPEVTYDFDRFLVVQGFIRRANTDNSPHTGLFVDRFMRIIRPDSLKKPMQFGGSNLGPPGSVRPFWAVFPLKQSERSLTLLYCNFNKPTFVPLDFTSSAAFTINGWYPYSRGLYTEQ